jgi:hypothetical protein
MPPSPGDYGIEGWTADGHAFQCYCPEKDYTQDELYEALRRKITADIPKLQRNAKQIAARIGATRIRSWLFVTPVVPHNDIHVPASMQISPPTLTYIINFRTICRDTKRITHYE